MNSPLIQFKKFSVHTANRQLLADVTLDISSSGVFGLMGPSGAGKSTLLKSINRMTELVSGLHHTGDIFFHNRSIHRDFTPDDLRQHIGILFQQPVVFPQSILANVLFGVRHLGSAPRAEWPNIAEQALRAAALWNEVKDRLSAPALTLSLGQQQRLCLARTLATQPEVLLMDEPTSALDPRSSDAIEELILSLSTERPIILVTHNLAQARRTCRHLAFITTRDQVGHCLAHGPTEEVLSRTDVPELVDFFSR
jgi:phosphate transport system ATP-binding protein